MLIVVCKIHIINNNVKYYLVFKCIPKIILQII